MSKSNQPRRFASAITTGLPPPSVKRQSQLHEDYSTTSTCSVASRHGSSFSAKVSEQLDATSMRSSNSSYASNINHYVSSVLEGSSRLSSCVAYDEDSISRFSAYVTDQVDNTSVSLGCLDSISSLSSRVTSELGSTQYSCSTTGAGRSICWLPGIQSDSGGGNKQSMSVMRHASKEYMKWRRMDNYTGPRVRNEVDNASITSGSPASNFDVSSLIGRDSRLSTFESQDVPSSFSSHVTSQLGSTHSPPTLFVHTLSLLPGIQSRSGRAIRDRDNPSKEPPAISFDWKILRETMSVRPNGHQRWSVAFWFWSANPVWNAADAACLYFLVVYGTQHHFYWNHPAVVGTSSTSTCAAISDSLCLLRHGSQVIHKQHSHRFSKTQKLNDEPYSPKLVTIGTHSQRYQNPPSRHGRAQMALHALPSSPNPKTQSSTLDKCGTVILGLDDAVRASYGGHIRYEPHELAKIMLLDGCFLLELLLRLSPASTDDSLSK
ncbi:UPF0481 protein [Senna tora]|uniref:UPF0481 protein n=1 Tax=Senna tora TaxID=362788 RepID=A0A835CMB0_9FABA|nr:UPF0481 protein [Senna tora]